MLELFKNNKEMSKKVKKEPLSLNQLVRENHYKNLIAGINEPIILEQKWGAGDFDNLRSVFKENDQKNGFKKQLVGIHAYRRLIDTLGDENNTCELDTFQLQIFVEEIIKEFLNFFKRMKLSDEDIAKGRAAFRLFISVWQYDFKQLGEIISKSYLSAVMKICCTTMPATHRDFTVFHLVTEVTLCDRIFIKTHERSECISRLNMLYKNGVFPTLRIPIKTIIAQLFDMMALSPAAMSFSPRDPMPDKCVAYNLEDNKENLVKCYDMEFKATEKALSVGEKDIKVKKAHLSVDSRAITIIPEKVKYFDAVQVTIEPEMIVKTDVKLTDKYIFTLNISVDEFRDEPWLFLGEKVTFFIDAEESMKMFNKHAKIWKWKIPKKAAKQVVKKEEKKSVETRKLNNLSPDTLSTISSMHNEPAWKKKIEDHNDRKRENHLRRQRTSSLASQTPKKKRGRPKKNQEQAANSETVENFKPKIDKVEKVAPPPRRFGAAKFKENSTLDKTLKEQNKRCDKIISALEKMLKLVKIGISVPPPRPPSPSSESEMESDSDLEEKKEEDTGIASREEESSDVMVMMKNMMNFMKS